MIIRKAVPSDLNTILSLTPLAIYDGTLGEVMPSEEKASSMSKALLEKGGFYLLAVEQDEILGWVLVGATKDSFTEQALGFIYELYIREQYRGQGHSKPLMKAATEHFRQQGYEEVRLSARVGNRAIRIYEDLGFMTKAVSMSLNLE